MTRVPFTSYTTFLSQGGSEKRRMGIIQRFCDQVYSVQPQFIVTHEMRYDHNNFIRVMLDSHYVVVDMLVNPSSPRLTTLTEYGVMSKAEL